MSRRLIATVIAMIVVAGCSAPSPTPGPSDSAPDSPAASPGAADLPPDILTLSVTTEDASAVVGSIGPDGGQLSTTAADGTTYTLEIPPEALLFAEDISMTPVTEVDGLPGDIAPEHLVGVQLGPDGLELFPPATLTVRPTSPIPVAGVATMSFKSDGTDAGLELFGQAASNLTIQVEHFSGSVSFWPVNLEWWELAERTRVQDFTEDQRQNLIALLDLEAQRQKFVRGEADPTGLPLLELISGLEREWDENVFSPLRRMAPNGCRFADAALRAYVVWEQLLQEVGLSLNGLTTETTGEQRALIEQMRREPPPELLTLKRDLCFEEEFQRCRHTGDFEHLATFIYGHFRQRELWGEVSIDDIELAQLYLERCGLWDLTIESIEEVRIAHPLGPVTQTFHQKRTYPIRWHPGPGLYGLIGTHAMGDGATEIVEASGSAPGCPAPVNEYEGTAPVDTAEIERLIFDQRPNVVTTFRRGLNPREFRIEQPDDDPIPRAITLDLSFGTQSWGRVWESCPTLSTGTGFSWTGKYVLTALGHDELNTHGALEIAVVSTYDDWVFDSDPFKATMTITKAFTDPYFSPDNPVLTPSVTVEAIITLEHTPAP